MNNSYTETTHVRVDYQKLHLVACTAAEPRYESTEYEKSTVNSTVDLWTKNWIEEFGAAL